MVASLRRGTYIIETILSETDETAIYTARNKERKRFIVSEIRSVTLINRFLPQLNKLMERGLLVCLTENSHLYVITRYCDGESAAVYFKAERPPIAAKLEMIRQAAFRMIEYADCPDIVAKSLLQPESLCVYRGEIHMNFYFAPYEERGAFSLFHDEISRLFSKEELRRYSYINIILRKLKNGIYTDFTQVCLDMGQLISKCGKGGAIISGIKAFCEKIKPPLKVITAAAALIIAAAVLFGTLVSGSRRSSEEAFKPIDHIGTVPIVVSEDKEFTEIEVGMT